GGGRARRGRPAPDALRRRGRAGARDGGVPVRAAGEGRRAGGHVRRAVHDEAGRSWRRRARGGDPADGLPRVPRVGSGTLSTRTAPARGTVYFRRFLVLLVLLLAFAGGAWAVVSVARDRSGP